MTRQLEITQPFDLEVSLTMGQAFRWRELPAGFYGDGHRWFSGVLGDNLVHIRQTDTGVEYRVGGPEGEMDRDLSELLSRYFRLDDDIAAIYADISRDPHIARLVRRYCGMRLLRQEPWECTVSYICSANNAVPRISRIVEMIADAFGDQIELDGEERRTFPTPERMLGDAEMSAKLDAMRPGLNRAANIADTARRIGEGELDLRALSVQPYNAVKSELMRGKGIGNKIADCIALFALDKVEAFPLDRHIGRGLSQWDDCPLQGGSGRLGHGEYRRTAQWAQHKFGKYAGYAGQYLFLGQRQEAAAEKLPFGTR